MCINAAKMSSVIQLQSSISKVEELLNRQTTFFCSKQMYFGLK